MLRATWLAVLLSALAGPVVAQDIPCPDPPLYPPTQAFVQPGRPCPDDDVRMLFATCAPCWDIVDVYFTKDALVVRTVGGENCAPDVCLPESTSIALGRFAAGFHSIAVKFITETVRRDSVTGDSIRCTFVNDRRVNFEVATTCNQNMLPYVKEVAIGGPPPCPTCPRLVCPGDSIPVTIRGEFPSNCFHLTNVELVPHPSASPMPVPPIVRLVYVQNDCGDNFPCTETPVPWERTVNLPPLPSSTAFPYWLTVDAALVRYTCTGPPDSTLIGEARTPFTVAERCSTTVDRCFLTSFVTHGDGPIFNRCDDFVGPDRPGYATFRIGSGVPLHGLEGSFVLSARHLEITSIEAIGAATGMRLAWQPTVEGARWVLYSEGNAAIPTAPPLNSSQHLPILRIEVRLRPSSEPPPSRVALRAYGLLGADQAGDGVNLCPIIPVIEPYDSYAVFCTGGTCDANRDGATDVRDLVTMVNCHNELAICDLRHVDCNGDGVFSLDDVFCCAHVLLGGGQPDTTGGRPDPSLRVRFGAPVELEGGIAVTVSLEGANPVSGARLVLRYPDDRFADATVEFPGRSSWLELHEANDGRVVVGMLNMVPPSSAAFRHSFVLRLTLRPGQQLGGEVAVEAAEFSDPQGVALLADLGGPAVTLGGGGVSLGVGKPNPFGREVQFSVTLAQESDLEVSIHDLNGRRVAVLHNGPAAAGGHPFRWEGRYTDGTQAPDGIYFYRARAVGQTLSRKVILLRQP